MKKQVSIFLISSLIVLNLISCSLNKPVQQDISNQENAKIQIVATVFPPYDFAKAITGNRAICTLLINPGSDVHSFSPTPEDIIKIQNADVFIYIGNKDDEWVYSTLGSMDPNKQKIIKLTDYVIAIKKESV
ncbi:MAG: zinc ABC transporter substrate-binding protein, partial [Caldisericia bacterium]|nr:zinc ABC transporter substrate-binding protein [Caldisericia bacterium]